jgi:hypothetical protein
MKKIILLISTAFVLIAYSCNNPSNEVNSNNNGGGIHNDSCGFGILTVVNNSWNNYRVLVDSTLLFTVGLKSSNGGSIPLGNHNIKVGVPQNYVLDTTFYVNDCISYTFYCQ